MQSLESAGDLWQKLCDDGLIKPDSYDKDLSLAIKSAFGLPARRSVGSGLAIVGVSAESLVRELLRQLYPYTLMLKDLLRLYARIGSASGTGENLRIIYDFGSGDPLDLLLRNFRQTTEKVVRGFQKVTIIWATADHFWSCPSIDEGSARSVSTLPQEWIDDRGTGNRLPARIPALPSVGLPDVDLVAGETVEVLRAVLNRAQQLVDAGALGAELPDQARSEVPVDEQQTRDVETIASLLSNRWLELVYEGLIAQVAAAAGDAEAARTFIALQGDWLSGLTYRRARVDAERRVLDDLLSLPTWGRRHEFYAAWLVTEMDEALDHRLDFKVSSDGALRFPFRETLVADLVCAEGVVQLWAEMRTAYDNPLGKSRRGGIQPDYRFAVEGLDRKWGTRLAIEAKQYLKAASKVHGLALADYTGGLPNAVVVLANYGPVLPSAITHVPSDRRSRAVIVDLLIPGARTPSRRFRHEIAQALPPPPSADRFASDGDFLVVTVNWAPEVHDVDLHAFVGAEPGATQVYHGDTTSRGVKLVADRYDGGPESIIILKPGTGHDRDIDLWVNVCSGESLSVARPSLTLQSVGQTRIVELAGPGADRLSDGLSWNPVRVVSSEVIIQADVYGALPGTF